MSSDAEALRELRSRTATLYTAVAGLMLVGIAVLAVYSIRLGPLTTPAAETSFGYALCVMSLMAAVIFHVVDRTYRAWPLGRRFAPSDPGPVSALAQVRFLQVLIIVLAGAAIAYLVGGLL